MSHALFHSLNIGTLATWLSVAGFGTVGVIVKDWTPEPAISKITETRLVNEDFTLGDDSSPATTAAAAETFPVVPAEILPTPPGLAALAEIEPLPEIPDFTSQPAKRADAPREPQPKAVTRKPSSTGTSGTPTGKTATSPPNGNGKPGTETSGMSNAARLAAGRMRAPSYPPYSRRNGQTGTVIVEFIVDPGGRVISAYAKSPSPYPLLNDEAVSTVRSWKFPPGGIMKLQRPIVFKLR